MGDAFNVQHDFLTDSYARHTNTKPLKDVDIFVVFNDSESRYRTEGVMSFDVTPAFEKGAHYVISYTYMHDWTPTDPTIHTYKATQANVHSKTKRTGRANSVLNTWQELFGPAFAKS
ncbi:MAG: hypothetical protein OXI96_10195 [Acidimicrobiaceae bacterium]|nr:hypothetical protein [Acidimicrobiaceae bacterium]